MQRFSHIDHWVFDLDNTLYPERCSLFSQIDVRMGEFISNLFSVDLTEARRIQKSYLAEHGTTLRGLMKNHGQEPYAFLDHVHDVDVSALVVDPQLPELIASLPGRKYVFTNADRPYTQRVLSQIGLDGAFDGVFDIIDAGFVPKPAHGTYTSFLKDHGIEPTRAVMFEDTARNLVPAHDLGMTTVWVRTESPWAAKGPGPSPYIHHETDDLAEFLKSLAPQLPSRP